MNEMKINKQTGAQEYFAHKLDFTTGPVEVARMISESQDIMIIDLRAEEDFERGHVPGAINLPQERWHTLEGLSQEAMNILYCYSQTCHLAAKAGWEFAGKGYAVMEMEGGFEAWKNNDLVVER
jgi:rhodanese-related sulfurtransferase